MVDTSLRQTMAQVVRIHSHVCNERAGELPWSRSQRIRTAAEIPLEVILVDEAELPLYERLAERAKHLRELGMSYRAIGRVLGVDYKVAMRAIACLPTSVPPRRR